MGNPMALRWGRLYRGTRAELSIEPAIAALGLPYRTQFPGFLFGFRYFPDVLLPTLKVVVEVDDPSHDKADKREADRERDEYLLREFGWRTVRVRNDEALRDPEGSLRAALESAGIGLREIEAARRRPLAECLPAPRRAPPKVVREARAASLQSARSKRRGSPGRRRSSRPAPSAPPRPIPVP